ncbi:MAG: glycosyltransferase, partial [Planctomycetota bacterium]
MSQLVSLATYNEIENLPSLVDAIRSILPQSDILVVDDASPDGTGDWCREQESRHEWFSAIHRADKLGLGTAAWAGINHAIDRDYEWLIILDADWSHPPGALPSMVAAAADADLVIGSRYCPGGGIENWPLSRRLISRFMNFATRQVLGGKVRDT